MTFTSPFDRDAVARIESGAEIIGNDLTLDMLRTVRIKPDAHARLGRLRHRFPRCYVRNAMMNIERFRSQTSDLRVDFNFFSPGRRAQKFDVQSDDRYLKSPIGLQIAHGKADSLKKLMRGLIDPGDQVRIVGDMCGVAVTELDFYPAAARLRAHDVFPNWCPWCVHRAGP